LSNIPQIGEILATTAALCWAIGVIFFKKAGEHLPPLSLNLFKGTIGFILLTPTLPLAGETFFPDVSLEAWILLGLSGVMGIAIADTLFFISLEKLGAGLTAVVDTSYAPIFLVLSFVWLGERMGVGDLFGAGLIVLGLLVGSISRPPEGKTRADIITGSLIGVSGIAIMGVSVMMIKEILTELPMLWSTWVRLFFGTVAILPIIALRKDRRELLTTMKPTPTWRWAVPGAIFGTYLAMVCWLGGMKHTDVSRAALLNQLSTIFIFALATMFLREPLTTRRVAAIILAVLGALLVVM
jgi:drug/metabolite transporter (DMT)-like permease